MEDNLGKTNFTKVTLEVRIRLRDRSASAIDQGDLSDET